MNKLSVIDMFFNNIIFKASFIFCCLEINVFTSTPTSYFSCVCVSVCSLVFGVLFYFWDGVFLCSPGYTETGYVVQGGRKLIGIPPPLVPRWQAWGNWALGTHT